MHDLNLKQTKESVNTQLIFSHRSLTRNNKQNAVINMTIKRIDLLDVSYVLRYIFRSQ